ncbi:MAG: 2-amino-4-hydroxy-6-hydroxymethyldihydropteridine diphosphokinase [Candidatus Auribacterota bacterium]
MTVLFSLGSNIEPRVSTLCAAALRLHVHHNLVLDQFSSFYETSPQDMESSSPFVNQVILAQTRFSPEELLGLLQSVEQELGRTRDESGEYRDRTIDIDILYYGDDVINTDQLTIPHPRIQDRPFVLIPMREIAPNMVHPVLKKTPSQMLADIDASRFTVTKI